MSARLQVERAQKRAAAEAAAQAQSKRTWTGWLLGGGQRQEPAADELSSTDTDMRGSLTDEEKAALTDMVAEQEDALESGACLRGASSGSISSLLSPLPVLAIVPASPGSMW